MLMAKSFYIIVYGNLPGSTLLLDSDKKRKTTLEVKYNFAVFYVVLFTILHYYYLEQIRAFD